MEPDTNDLMERLLILQLLIKQHEAVTLVMLARCGGELTITREEFEFVEKTYDSLQNIEVRCGTLHSVFLKLRLKS